MTTMDERVDRGASIICIGIRRNYIPLMPEFARLAFDEDRNELRRMARDVFEADDSAQAKENNRLRDLTGRLADDLANYINIEYQLRHDHPDDMRRWKRDMAMVNEARVALQDKTQ